MRVVIILAAVLFASAAAADGTPQKIGGADPCTAGTTAMNRVDLFFAATGDMAAWRSFLATIVTPRFPDGLTVLDGSGQWHGPHGLEREHTDLLVIFYHRSADSDVRIEAIRSLYKVRFRQTSVLRADSTACVSF